MVKSTFKDIDPFWVLPYLYKVGDHLSHLLFNSTLQWLSFNINMINSQLKIMASSALPPISAIIKFDFIPALVYVLPCLKDAFYWPYLLSKLEV